MRRYRIKDYTPTLPETWAYGGPFKGDGSWLCCHEECLHCAGGDAGRPVYLITDRRNPSDDTTGTCERHAGRRLWAALLEVHA